MTKTITNIPCPSWFNITNDFGSHLPLLFLSIENTEGRIVELGSGNNSTPLLEVTAKDYGRNFKSFETNKEWAVVTGATHIDDYMEGVEYLPLFKKLLDIGLLFIDCAPAEIRKSLVVAYKDSAEVIIVHDTQPSADYVYGLKDILSTFKYRLDFQPEGFPHTTAVSNFVNVTEWI